MNSVSTDVENFYATLAAHGRSPEIPDRADIYGWLVGSWELEVLHYWGKNVTAQGLKGEVHAAWVLEGRAIQDTWIMPQRSERTGEVDKTQNMYGTTLRLWDSSIQAWRITWRNPAGDHHEDQIGNRNGQDILQLGMRPNGDKTRWSFTEIKSNSFHWLGESLAKGSATWQVEGEFRARRI